MIPYNILRSTGIQDRNSWGDRQISPARNIPVGAIEPVVLGIPRHEAVVGRTGSRSGTAEIAKPRHLLSRRSCGCPCGRRLSTILGAVSPLAARVTLGDLLQLLLGEPAARSMRSSASTFDKTASILLHVRLEPFIFFP